MDTVFRNASSKLVIICGPMYSSKTSTLLIELTRYADVDLSVLYINSEDDTRGETYSTHNSSLHHLSNKVTTQKTSRLQDLSDDYLDKFKVIGVDESQFFEDLIPFVKRMLKRKKILYVAGLDGDSKQNMFGQILHLIPYASEVRKLTAVCEICRNIGRIVPANLTIRRDNLIHLSKSSDLMEKIENSQYNQVKDVGAKDKYLPVCNDCLFHDHSTSLSISKSLDKDLSEINYTI